MRISKVDTMIIDVPFEDGGKGQGIGPTTWNRLEVCLVRIEDDRGTVGWGEGFGYFTVDATKAMIDRTIAPVLVGTEVDDPYAWNLATQRRLHLFGRHGITVHAISGVDMALWDLKAKREGVPLHRLLGGAGSPEPVPFYASLVRYADDAVAPRVCERALADGFRELKLHEITIPHVAACRDAVGPEVPISVDVNCAWSEAEARAAIPALIELNASWLEEPTFPPERFGPLQRLRGRGLPIAAGENWYTAEAFDAALAAGACDLAQPSVTKVGGVSEFARIARACAAAEVPLMPHCPYFGPGLFASLQLAAAFPGVRALEWLYVDPELWPAKMEPLGPGGTLTPSDAPGLGFEPEPAALENFRRA